MQIRDRKHSRCIIHRARGPRPAVVRLHAILRVLSRDNDTMFAVARGMSSRIRVIIARGARPRCASSHSLFPSARKIRARVDDRLSIFGRETSAFRRLLSQIGVRPKRVRKYANEEEENRRKKSLERKFERSEHLVTGSRKLAGLFHVSRALRFLVLLWEVPYV